MNGQTILHYKIIEEIGRGGMGVVYKAHDTKLNRNVAIKFLPDHICKDCDEQEQFKFEAQAAASLNHPNIATIYAIEESGRDIFIVMEYIDGTDLKHVIEATQPEALSIPQVIQYAIQISAGLSAAHEQGIVHRDIKSANIMITQKDEVKIMDFGLATPRENDESLANTSTLGTVAYMAPEQLDSEFADIRSDIWALGVVLYEMLTGSAPFGGDYRQAVIYSILNEQPISVSEIRGDMPEKLNAVIEKSLAKRPEHRYQQVMQLHDDLNSIQMDYTSKQTIVTPDKKSWKRKIAFTVIVGMLMIISLVFLVPLRFSVTGKRADSSIAVLYLKNLGAADDDPYSYGITQDLIIDLAKIADIRVAPMKDVLSIQNADLPIKKIAEQLHVRYVFDASLQRNDDSFKLSGQLVDAQSGKTLWSDRLLAPADQINQLQGRIARTIISTLDLRLSSALAQNLGHSPTTSSDAYEYYLRGKYIYEKRTSKDEAIIARGLFDKAIALDSSFIAARIALGTSYEHMAEYDRAEQAYSSALAYAKRGGDKYGEARAFLGLGSLLLIQPNYSGALKFFLSSLEISTENGDRNGMAWALNTIAIVYDYTGRPKEALQNYTRSLRIFRELGDRKQESKLLNNLGSIYFSMGHVRKALDYYNQRIAISTELSEPHPIAYGLFNSGNCYLSIGEYSKALDYLQRALVIFSDIADRMMVSFTTGSIGEFYVSIGDTAHASQFLQKSLTIARTLKDREAESDFISLMGELFKQQGKMEPALAYFKRALRMSRKIHYMDGTAAVLEMLGDFYFSSADYPTALKSLTSADSIYQISSADHHRLRVLALMALCEQRIGHSARARRLISQTETLLQSVEPTTDFLNVYWCLARAYDLLNNPGKYNQYLGKAYATLSAIENTIDDHDMRMCFRDNVPENRSVIAAWKKQTDVE